jgi:large subunit ribosomal protein L4
MNLTKMELNVYLKNGTKSDEKVQLESSIFEIEPNHHAIYLAVKTFLAHQRQGTHKAKERAEVSGGGKKPWRQKGRGTARAGSSRSPVWIGGGTIFGPRPHLYKLKVSKKVNQLARKSAYSIKAKDNCIMIVEDFKFDEPKTKQLIEIMKNLSIADKKILLLTTDNEINIFKSGRNIPNVNVLEARNASTYDILNNKVLLIQKSAIPVITSTFSKN